MSAENERRPGETEAAGAFAGAGKKSTRAERADTVAARIGHAEPALDQVWDALASGQLDLSGLREQSPALFAIFVLGWQSGIDSQRQQVAQAEHTANRLYAVAMNEPERAQAIAGRMDRAIASMPPDIEPHSPEWFERTLRGAIGGAA